MSGKSQVRKSIRMRTKTKDTSKTGRLKNTTKTGRLKKRENKTRKRPREADPSAPSPRTSSDKPILDDTKVKDLLNNITKSLKDKVDKEDNSKLIKYLNNEPIDREKFMYSMGSADANKDGADSKLVKDVFGKKPDGNERSLYDWAGTGENIKSIAKVCLYDSVTIGTSELIPFSRIKGIIQKPIDCDCANYDCGFLPQTLVSTDVRNIHTPGNTLDTGPSSSNNNNKKQKKNIKYDLYPKRAHILPEKLMSLIGYDNTKIYIDDKNEHNGAKLYDEDYEKEGIENFRIGNERKKKQLKGKNDLSEKAALLYVKSLGDRLIVLYCYIYNIIESKQVTLFTCDSIVFLMCYILNIRCVYNTNDLKQKKERISNVYNYNPIEFDWNKKIKAERQVILNEYKTTLDMLKKLSNTTINAFAFTTENKPYDAKSNKKFINYVKQVIEHSYNEVKKFKVTKGDASVLLNLRRNKLITLFKPQKNKNILYFITSRNKINDKNYYKPTKRTQTIYNIFKSDIMSGGSPTVISNSNEMSVEPNSSEIYIPHNDQKRTSKHKSMKLNTPTSDLMTGNVLTPDPDNQYDGCLSGDKNEEILKLYNFVHEIYSNFNKYDTKNVIEVGENLYYEEDDIYDHLTYIFYYKPDYTYDSMSAAIKDLIKNNSYFGEKSRTF